MDGAEGTPRKPFTCWRNSLHSEHHQAAGRSSSRRDREKLDDRLKIQKYSEATNCCCCCCCCSCCFWLKYRSLAPHRPSQHSKKSGSTRGDYPRQTRTTLLVGYTHRYYCRRVRMAYYCVPDIFKRWWKNSLDIVLPRLRARARNYARTRYQVPGINIRLLYEGVKKNEKKKKLLLFRNTWYMYTNDIKKDSSRGA